MMRDNKLKKGQIRIIVIATGFPERSPELAAIERSLFSLPIKDQQTARGKIYNEITKQREEIAGTEAKDEPRKEKEEPIVTAQPQKREESEKRAPRAEEEEDMWGAIPNFLRRTKK